jgi:hypothetical protein
VVGEVHMRRKPLLHHTPNALRPPYR